MLTDWTLFARVAAELEAALAGERITSAGILPDGRTALRTRRASLTIDVAAPTPYVSLEAAALPRPAPGWGRAVAEMLVGLRVRAVRARHGDRLIAIDCAATSRFGIETSYRLVAELVPRFGNLLILKDDVVIAAIREFAPESATRRTILRGEIYEPPPLPAPSATLAPLTQAFEELAAGGQPSEPVATLGGALRQVEPAIPRLVAESLASQALAADHAASETRALELLRLARTALAELERPGKMSAPVYVYYDAAGALVQTHPFRLAQFAGTLREVQEPQLLPLLAGVFATARGGEAAALHARRKALGARVEKRRRALGAERTELERVRDASAERDALRTDGELLYANLHEIPPGSARFVPSSAPEREIRLDPDLSPKENARAFFRRYRKAQARAAYAEDRLKQIEPKVEALEALAWEAERADADTLDELGEELRRLERPTARATRAKARKALEYVLGTGARIFVGRSPASNVELTFRQARPTDLWFHARATPGAHVILHLDEAREPVESELIAAAQLAAFHSRARGSQNVAVDYTARKHVRRRSGAAAGLVWYDFAQTIFVSPKDGTDS